MSVDNSTAENNTTIYTISESPENRDVIWVGTDDGYVQVTRDGGETWVNVTANIPELPPGLWVSHLEASPHDAASAHLTVDGHRSGDMTVYVYRTGDFGQRWQSVSSDDIEGFAHVVVQDPVNHDLLFLGTELGLYVTLDGGRRWARFKGDLPKVPVRDLDIHPREHDLIIGTHGRGIYILDDLTPLRSLAQETLESKLSLLPARAAVMELSGGLSWFSGDDEFIGRSPPQAASIFFYQKRRHIFGDLKIEIYDSDGELVSTVPAPKVKGLNRADWPMRLPPPKMPPATTLVPAFVGPRVPEGAYTFKLIKGKETFEGTIELIPDPRSTHSPEDRRLQQRTALDLYRMLARLTYVVDAAIYLEEQATARGEELGAGRLASRLRDYASRLDDFRTGLVSTSKAGMLSGDEKLREKLAMVYGPVSGYDGRPTETQLDRTRVLGGQLEAAAERVASLAAEVEALNTQLERRGLEPLTVLTRQVWEARQKKSGGSATSSLGAKRLAVLLMRLPLFPIAR